MFLFLLKNCVLPSAGGAVRGDLLHLWRFLVTLINHAVGSRPYALKKQSYVGRDEVFGMDVFRPVHMFV